MKPDQTKAIIRNAENQLAALLADKVDRFRKSTKDRVGKAQDIIHLADQLGVMVRRNASTPPPWVEQKPMSPMPSRQAREAVEDDENLRNELAAEVAQHDPGLVAELKSILTPVSEEKLREHMKSMGGKETK